MPMGYRKSQQSRSNGDFLYTPSINDFDTVQTSWRPQLPLPKDANRSDDSVDEMTTAVPNVNVNVNVNEMDRLNHLHHTKKDTNSQQNNSSSQQSIIGGNHKKWSFGRLFRKKKPVETDSSSEEDRKAGFVPAQKRFSSGAASNKTKPKTAKSTNRGSKLIGAGFDHIVVNPRQLLSGSGSRHHHVDNEFFLPVETVPVAGEPFYQNQQPQPPSQSQPKPQSQQQLHPQQQYSRSTNSLDRRSGRSFGHKSRSSQGLMPGVPVASDVQGIMPHTSSEEELISLNSSTFSKYRSDESIHSGGVNPNGQSRRSRAARNERYYKRLSRDGELSHGQVPVVYAPQPAQHWKTQPVPLSLFNGQVPTARQTHVRNYSQSLVMSGQQKQQTPSSLSIQRLRNTGSLQHVAPSYVQWGQLPQQQQSKNLQNSVNSSKRSISYDNQIHLQNINGRTQTKPLPPPPPPRDPLRRVNVGGHLQNGSSGDLRPVSYAFDQNGVPVLPPAGGLSGRCVSDDKIWAAQTPLYQSVHSLNVPMGNQSQSQTQAQVQSQPAPSSAHHRRFITRAERDAHPGKKSLPNGLDFHYVADATPRSRKPIHMLEPQGGAESVDPPPPPTAGILRTTKSGLPASSSASDFWKRLDGGSQRRGRDSERSAGDAALSTKPRSISSSRAGELRSYPIPMYSEVFKPTRKAPPPPVTPPASAPASASHPDSDEVDSVVCGSLHIKPGQDVATNYVEIRNNDRNKSQSMPNHYLRRSGEIATGVPNKYEEYVAEKREQHAKPLFNPPTPPQRKLSIPPPAVPPIYFPRKKPANLEEAINELEAIYKSLGLTEEPEKKERIPTPSEFEKFALEHADEYDDDGDSPAGEPDPIRDDVAYRNIQLANLQHKTSEKQPPFGIPIGPVVPSPQTDYLHVTPTVDKDKVPNAPDIVKDDLAVRALRKDQPGGSRDKATYPLDTLQKKNRATRTQSANIYSLIQRDAAKPSGGDLLSYMELTRSIDRAGSMSDIHKDDVDSDIPATLTLLRNLKEQDSQQQQQQQQKKVSVPFRHPSQGGAICQLPKRLGSPVKDHQEKMPVPLPRKSLTPEPPVANHRMEDALNKIAKDAQESSVKLGKELQELRKEALITASRPKTANLGEEKLEQELQEIEAVSEAAKRCGKMLLDTLPDAVDTTNAASKPRKLHKEGKLIKAIDQVSEAANAVCEKILKDIVKTDPPIPQPAPVQEASIGLSKSIMEPLVMPNLIKKLDPIKSEKIEAIAQRCMRQLSELAVSPDYDNLTGQSSPAPAPASASGSVSSTSAAAIVACNDGNQSNAAQTVDTILSTLAEMQTQTQTPSATQSQSQALGRRSLPKHIEEIDKIMQECEAQVRLHGTTAPSFATSSGSTTATATNTGIGTGSHLLVGQSNNSSNSNTNSTDDRTTAPSITSSSESSSKAPAALATSAATTSTTTMATTSNSTTASSFSSSSDCLAKSSSPSGGRRQSSSITSFNPYSSSDYMKSPTSSECHAPSTDPIKTFSTTSYDVPSTSSATPNITANSAFSYSPSPPLNLTPVSGRARTAKASAGAVAAGVAIGTDEIATGDERARSSSPSQYNSSEELAMIFGVEERPKQSRSNNKSQLQSQPRDVSGKVIDVNHIHATLSSLPSCCYATTTTTVTTTTTTKTTTTATTTTTINATTTLPNHASSHAKPVIVQEPPLPATNSPAVASADASTDASTDATFVNVFVDADDNDIVSHPQSTIATSNGSPTAVSACPISCKLETIPEILVEQDHPNGQQSLSTSVESSPKLSPNFNKIYASKISILVDRQDPDNDHDNDRDHEDDMTNDDPSVGHRSMGRQSVTQFDSLSSLEETSSNPDSGNVSLSDFPVTSKVTGPSSGVSGASGGSAGAANGNTTNACLKLQTACNSRFEIRKTFVSEICIETIDAKSEEMDFPPLPTEKELLDSLRESGEQSMGDGDISEGGAQASICEETVDAHTSAQQQSPLKPATIVYETPHLNMNISEVKLTYENGDRDEQQQQDDNHEATNSSSILEQIKECTAEVEKLNDTLDKMPNRRKRERSVTLDADKREESVNGDESDGSKALALIDSTSSGAIARRRHYQPNDDSNNDDDDDDDDDDSCGRSVFTGGDSPAGAVFSIFGEHRAVNSLTLLEHVLMACSLGVITPYDLFTLFVIIVGVLTIVAIVLF